MAHEKSGSFGVALMGAEPFAARRIRGGHGLG
ncbi:hypothetical protein GGQ76_004244 [Aureimonas jatrophae]|uniref:Uncharacterized protein n=1 Tax=Aureimonas jatrophae TaxID=1166073 RepID=A0A1H0MJS2_9HYPH|nr:hypothetical protein [Aureimonas jatrophae]SDO80662.1 hypothetical protein SAMN05192530_11434 [Aureimonas jatrophae]